MNQSTLMMLVSAAGIISAIILGWIGQNRMVRQNTRNDAGSDAVLKTDVDYIKRGVDDMRLEQRAQGQRFEALSERVIRVEESVKQAHKRINRLEGSKDDN
ncbi:hypothetical protein SAMN04487969_11989 [Paenibacillus algorifonticola]|uniref:Uncharacterized protein n=1 Tax=Paenibacillus algorifonticola TaxID=684063 RepID=A0A1I2H242_9BACL|nr:hypothetical protein [Paenibacillus algorifonticola]SFF23329.1 hypothetical protein SAMN04487969_11989 [Paenibacillus algorifonticola]